MRVMGWMLIVTLILSSSFARFEDKAVISIGGWAQSGTRQDFLCGLCISYDI